MSMPRSLTVWTIDEPTLRSIIDSSETQSEVIERCGSRPKGTAPFRALQERCREFGIDLGPLKMRSRGRVAELARVAGRLAKIPLDEVLVEHSDYNRQNLKMRLIAEGILPNKCDRCGAQPEWMGEPLTLVLDHINGVWDDNRRENLRLLCPNCNSQTATFSGRRLKKSGTATSRRKDREGSCCRRCGNPIHPDTKNQLCPTCFASGRRKVERPTKDELSALMGTMTWVRMGEVYGVSDNAVRKWARSYGLLK